MALISDRIFEILNAKGMTQKEFAIKTGIAESTISDWKRRGANPAAENIMKISQVLGVEVEELLSGVVKRGKRGRGARGTFLLALFQAAGTLLRRPRGHSFIWG